MPDAIDAFMYDGLGLIDEPDCKAGLHLFTRGQSHCRCGVDLCGDSKGSALCTLRVDHLGQHHNPYNGLVW